MCQCCGDSPDRPAKILDIIVMILTAIQLLLIMFKLKTESTLIHNTSWFFILFPFWIAVTLLCTTLCVMACLPPSGTLQKMCTIEFIAAIVVLILTIYTLENEGPKWPLNTISADQLLTYSFSSLLIWHTMVCVLYFATICKDC
jgi:hypothetical protein